MGLCLRKFRKFIKFRNFTFEKVSPCQMTSTILTVINISVRSIWQFFADVIAIELAMPSKNSCKTKTETQSLFSFYCVFVFSLQSIPNSVNIFIRENKNTCNLIAWIK